METAMRNVSINDRTTPLSPIIKSEPLPQDQPLDFSKRVRHSLEDESMRKVSEDSAVSDLQPIDKSPSSQPAHRTNHSTDSGVPLDANSHSMISEPPRVSMPSINSFLPQTTLAATGMGMFYPGAPVFPNFMPPGFPPMWPNPMAAAAMMQQQQEAAKKLLQTGIKPSIPSPSQRGLNAIRPHFMNKDPLAALSGVRQPFPGLPPAPGILPNNSSTVGGSVVPDPGLLAEALKSHEEMFNAYKQQVLSQKASDDSKRGHRRHVTSMITNGRANHSVTSSSQLPSSTVGTIAEATTTHDSGEDNSNHASQAMQCSNEDSQKSEDNINVISNGDSGSADTPPGSQEGIALPPASKQQSIHSSDESIPSTSDSRRSLTPAHSNCSEFLDTNGMRPRSSTLPTQSDSRTLSYSPAPSTMSNGHQSSGPATPNSKGSFRKRARTLPDDQKDEAYWERRRKNNEAAKRSRDSRRAKEDEIAIRAAFLEQENLRLRVELAALRQQTAKLRSELIIIQGPADVESTTPAEGS